MGNVRSVSIPPIRSQRDFPRPKKRKVFAQHLPSKRGFNPQSEAKILLPPQIFFNLFSLILTEGLCLLGFIAFRSVLTNESRYGTLSTMQTIIGNEITVYSINITSEETPKNLVVSAVLPSMNFDGRRVVIRDWRMDETSVFLRYSMSGDTNASIFEGSFPVKRVETVIAPPSRSKNWQWLPHSGWHNVKTGKIVNLH